MSLSKNFPASIRYLKARLRTFKKPKFWGGAAILGLVGVFAVQYWQNPEWFSTFQDAPNPNASDAELDALLSDEERAIGADIDSLPLLIQELSQNPNTISATPGGSQPGGSAGLMESLQTDPAGSARSPNATPPAAPQPQASPLLSPNSLGPFGTAPGNNNSSTPGMPENGGFNFNVPAANPFVGNSGVNGSNTSARPESSGMSSVGSDLGSAANRNNPPRSALQAEIDRLPAPAAPRPVVSQSNNESFFLNGSNASSSEPGNLSGVNPVPGGTIDYRSLPGSNSMSAVSSPYSLNLAQPAPTVPGVPNIPTGVASPTGVSSAPTLPGAPESFALPTVRPLPQRSGFSEPRPLGTTGNQGPFAAPNSSSFSIESEPFSVPRPIPGRNIGGGRINTFANP